MVLAEGARRRRRGPWWLMVAFACLAAGTSTGSAAQLTVTSTDLLTATAERCTSTTLSVHVNPTGFSFGQNKAAVQVTNLPPECFGQSVQVAVANGAGTLLATGTTTCAGSPCTIGTGTYNAPSAASAHVLVATWGIPASWDSVCTTFFVIFMTCT